MEINEVLHKGEIVYKGQKIISYEMMTMCSESSFKDDAFNTYNLKQTESLFSKINDDIYISGVKQFKILNPLKAFVPIDIKTSSDIMLQTGRVLSIFTDVFYIMGAEGSVMERKCQTWDLVKQSFCHLRDLFVVNNWKYCLFNLVRNQISTLEAEMGMPCFINWKQKIYESFEKDRFYLTSDGIVIYLPQGSIAPDIWGIPTFLINYRNVDGILKIKCD